HKSGNKLGQSLLQSGTDRVEVIRHPAERIPEGMAVEIFEGQFLQVFVHIFAKIIHRLLRHAGHDKLLDVIEQTAENIQTGKHKENLSDFGKFLAGSG